MFDRLFVTLSVGFAGRADEEAFADACIRRNVPVARAFLIVAALAFCSSYWDELVDPVQQQISSVRLFFAAPLMSLCALALFVKPLQRHVETIVLADYMIVQIAQARIYIIDGLFTYAIMGFVLIYLAFTAAFALRVRFVVVGAFMAYAGAVIAPVIARETEPGWPVISNFAILSAIVFGLLSTSFRERAARTQFLAARALANSRARADDLFASILPASVIARIEAGEATIADSFEDVSVVVADLSGFTALSRDLTPQTLVDLLDDFFSRFDLAAAAHHMEKIKTVGDAYLAIGGMDGRADHAVNAARFALAILAEARAVIDKATLPIDIRVGVHSGPAMAGVIGRGRPSFDCWGRTVRVAGRLEAAAMPGTVLVSDAVRRLLVKGFETGPTLWVKADEAGHVAAAELRAEHVA